MAQWLKFKLIKKPYYDRNGNILISIKGRRNRKNKDEFHGGGKVYPDIPEEKTLERWERGDLLLLKMDITEAEAEEIKTRDKAMKYKTSPKFLKNYNHKDFKTKRLNNTQAKNIKTSVFGVIEEE